MPGVYRPPPEMCIAGLSLTVPDSMGTLSTIWLVTVVSGILTGQLRQWSFVC